MNKFLKIASVVALSVVLGVAVYAADGSFSASSSSGGATAYIPAGGGSLDSLSLTLDVATGATVTVHRPQKRTTLQSAASSTSLVVKSDSGVAAFGAVVPTTSDAVLVNASGTFTLAQIDSVVTNGVDTNSYFTVGVDTSITAAAGDNVYLSVLADQVSIPVGASDVPYPFANRFTGFPNAPVAIQAPAGAGASVISGTYER